MLKEFKTKENLCRLIDIGMGSEDAKIKDEYVQGHNKGHNITFKHYF